MADLIIDWLNKEVQLSKQVTEIEKDFANGYLFGELLYKFNQQPNFTTDFSTKKHVSAKIDNWKYLQPTLSKLGVTFDANVVDKITKEQRGEALRIIYQLKMHLEKVYPPTDFNVVKNTGKIGDNRPAMKITLAKDSYDRQTALHFSNRLQSLNKPQKQIIMERHLKKFNDEADRQDMQAKYGDKEEQMAKQNRLREMRSASINKLARNAAFMGEWLEKGVQDWQKNQSKRKERERRELEFEYKETEKYHKLALTKISDASKEVNEGIAQFEKTLGSLGISTKVHPQDAERAVSMHITSGGSSSPFKATLQPIQQQSRFTSSLKPLGGGTAAAMFSQSLRSPGQTNFGNGPAMTLTTTGLRSKDKKVISEKQKKERERRRRKMIVDQMTTYQEMETKQREDQVLARMTWHAKQEEELIYEKWRTEQCKNVIVDNRKLREARYEKRREIDQQTAQWREEEMIRQIKDQVKREQETMIDRDHEMRICHKQAHRERRNEFGAELFDAIFEIANEAYIHQQHSDSQDIDSRNWHEWLQLFIDQMPIQGTLSRLAEVKSEPEANDTFLTQEQRVEPQEKLDQMELEDYLKNQGQWNKEIILENPPNLEQFLTGQTDAPAAAAGGKGGAKAPPPKGGAPTESIILEEGDTDLPQEAPNNFQLGDAIENIVNLNFEARQPYKRQKVPLQGGMDDLKVCFVGYAFAGKKTQAERIAQEFGLKTFQLSDLVQESLDFYSAHPQPLMAGSAPTIDQTIIDDGTMSTDSEIDESYNAEEDFRLCGATIDALLKDGQEITDEVYVSLYIAKIRMTYPHKTKKQLRQELRIKVEKQRALQKKIEQHEQELNELINPPVAEQSQVEEGNEQEVTIVNTSAGSVKNKKKHAHHINQLQAKIEELNKELSALDQSEKSGWILLDFPSTFAQAKLLETALSGYVPKQECQPVDREAQFQDAYLLVQPTAKEEPPKTLIKSGLDAVIWFDLSREECMRRALGRRFDPEENKMYHIEDVPPPTDQAPLCERLVAMDEEHNIEATLIDRWISFDQGSKSLENWLVQFGDKKTERCILYKLNAHTSQDEMTSQIKDVLNAVIQSKKLKEHEVKERINAYLAEQELLEQQQALKLQQEEEEQKRVEEEQASAGEGAAEQIAHKKEEPKVERPEPATERVPAKEPNVQNVDGDFKPTILKVWQELSLNYKHQMKKVFREIRVQRERVVSTLSATQRQYLEFIHRPDTKQEKLEQFIRDFNDFSDQFPDLREDESTKDELHQRVDTLSDELWEITEDRKEQHIEERKKIMESGWVEHELAFMVSSAQSLMQAEVDKFKSSIQIIQDYYHAFEDKLIPEAPAVVTQELVTEGEELPPVEVIQGEAANSDPLAAGSYTYPRLDKLFEKALKAQFVLDVTLNASAAGADKKGGAPAGKGKDPKKPAEDEKPAEESQYVREMRQAIKVEKSILRFRLTQVRNWALKRLRDIRSKAIKVYVKLEDWIHVANKAENDSIEEMCVVLKRAIEEEKKIQNELRIKFMDFCVDETIMNYIEPPPEKLPAMEQVRTDRFNIRQLKTLVCELEELAKDYGDGNGGIPNKVLVDLLMRKLENSKTLWDEGSLPEEWWTLKEYDFQNLVRNLDRRGEGVVNWKLLATYIILLRSPLPSDKDIDALKKAFDSQSNHGLLDINQFTQLTAWFDQFEYSQDRDYSHPFPRLRSIKELLFQVHREHALPSSPDQERISKQYLLDVLHTSAKQIINSNIVKKSDVALYNSQIKTYGDVLFMQANLAMQQQPRGKKGGKV